MAISQRAVGAWAASNATTQTVTLPTHQAGDMLIVRAIRKPFTNPDDIVCNTAGWTAVAAGRANGSTANGNGTGSMAFKAFWKVAESASETNPVVTWGTTAAPGAAVAVSYQKGGSESWTTPTGDGGGDATARTAQTSTIATHVSVTSGDLVDFFRGQCDDSGALTVPTITQTGVTYNTVTEYPATALLDGTSNDIAADGGYRIATAGTSSAAAVVTGTSAASEQHGAWMTRLRVAAIQDVAPGFINQTAVAHSVTITAPQAVVVGLIDRTAVIHTPTVTQGTGALLVVADAGALTTDDTAVRNRLIAAGYAVTNISDETAAPSTVYTIGVIAESVVAATLGTKYRNVTYPVLVLDNTPAVNMDLMLGGPNVAGQTQVTVFDPNHPAAGGQSGNVTVFTSSVALRYADKSNSIAPGVHPVLTQVGDDDNVIGFVYEAGSELYNSHTAEAKRGVLHLFHAAYGGVYNSNALAFLDSFLAWLVRPNQIIPALGLLDQTAVAHAPTVSQGAQSVSVGLITQTAVAHAPTIGRGISLGQIDRTAVAHAPTVTSLATISVARINQTASPFAPTVTQSQTLRINHVLPSYHGVGDLHGYFLTHLGQDTDRLTNMYLRVNISAAVLSYRFFVQWDAFNEWGYGADHVVTGIERIDGVDLGNLVIQTNDLGIQTEGSWYLEGEIWGDPVDSRMRVRAWFIDDAVPAWSTTVSDSDPTIARDDGWDYGGVASLLYEEVNPGGPGHAVFSPEVDVGAVNVSLGLIDRTAVAHAPTITTANAISVALINQAAVAHAPTVTQSQTVTVALINQAAATFAPTITTANAIVLGLISQLAVAHSPTVTSVATVAVAQIDRTAQAHAPTITTTASISVGLINQAAQAHAPTITTANAISVGVINQTASPFAPSVHHGLSLGLISQPATAHAPTISVGAVTISVGLINQAATAFAPTITTGNVNVAPNLINQTAVAHAPTVGRNISLGLIDQTAAPFSPTVTSLATISLALTNQTATAHAPTITVGAASVSFGVIDQTAATFTPTVTATASVVFARIDQTAQAHAPSVARHLHLDRIDQTAAPFAPTITTSNAIALGLIDQTAQTLAPSLHLTVYVDFIDRTAQAHAPTVVNATQISLDLIDQTAVAFDPTVTAGGFVVEVDQIDRTAVAHSPTVTTGAVDISVGQIDQTAATFAPTITASAAIVLGRIDQPATTFAPTVTSSANISLNQINRTAVAHQPTVSTTYAVSVDRIDQPAATFDITVTTGAVTIVLPRIDQTATAFAPEVAREGAVDVGFINQTAVAFEPTITGGAAISIRRPGQGFWYPGPKPGVEQEIELTAIEAWARAFSPTVEVEQDIVLLGLDDESLLKL